MISAATRTSLIARLRAEGTLALEPQMHKITRADATQPLIQHIDALAQGDNIANGTPWLAPSHLQQVLP